MDDASPEGTDDPEGSADEPGARTSGILSTFWHDFRSLAWALAASTLLHAALLGTTHLLRGLNLGLDADIEWMEGEDELRAPGMGVRTESSNSDFADAGSALPDIGQQRALEKTLRGQPPPPVAESTPESDESGAAASTQVAADAGVASTPDAGTRRTDRTADAGSVSPDVRRARRAAETFDDLADHPALARGGPNDLPDLRGLAPGNARVSALIRTDRIREQPYEEAIRRLLRVLPDYRLLLGTDAFDPIDDMHWFFMASPDPRYVDKTFLAVGHDLSGDRVRSLVDRRYPTSPPWQSIGRYPARRLVPEDERYGDPRHVLTTESGLVLVAKPELLEETVGPLSPDSELLSRNIGQTKQKNDARPRGPRPRLLDGLARLHSVAREDETVVLMSARGLGLRLPGVGRLPRFEEARLRVRNPDAPRLEIDLRFRDDRRARSFAEQCPAMRRAIVDAIPLSGFIGVDALLGRLQCRIDGNYVEVAGEYTPEQVEQLGELATSFAPRPAALDTLPAPPEARRDDGDAGAPSGDADTSGPTAERDGGTAEPERPTSSPDATRRTPSR